MDSFFEWMLESSLLVLLMLGVRRIFTGRVRYVGVYALWLVVMIRFLVPVNFISTPLSVANIFSGTSSPEQGGQVDPVGKLPVLEMGNQDRDAAESQETDGDAGVQENTLEKMGSESAARVLPIRSGAAEDGKDWRKIPLYVWGLISCTLFLWLLLSNLLLMRKMKKERVLYRDHKLPGGRESLKIYVVSAIQNPCLYGFFHPAIYLPRSLVADGQADGEEIGQMILHEYVHYRHRDHIWAMIRMLLVSVYWFHPLLWLAASCSKKDAELACDESVIRQLGEERRLEYGGMLVRWASDAGPGDFRYAMLPMSRRGKEIEKRIRAISARKHYSRWLLIPLTFAVLGVLGITCTAGSDSQASKAVGDREQSGGMFSGLDPESGAVQYLNANGAGTGAFTVEGAFRRYIETFTEAVNTGNVDEMAQVLAADRDVYRQQCALVKNYYKRGIHEEILSWSVLNEDAVTEDQVEILSKEKIRVRYQDGTENVVRQKYRYTCQRIGQKWIIVRMDENKEGKGKKAGRV